MGSCRSSRSAGSGSEAIDDGGGGAAAWARASSGVPPIEGLPDRGSNRLSLEATRSSQQPAQAGAATESGAGDRPRVVLGFRSDLGGREAARGAWDYARSRDIAAVDDRGRAVARSQAAAKACLSAPLPA